MDRGQLGCRNLWEVSWRCLGAPFSRPGGPLEEPRGGPEGSKTGSGGLFDVPWRPLGALKQAWSAKGGLLGAYGSLLEASWSALGALLELSGAVLEAF